MRLEQNDFHTALGLILFPSINLGSFFMSSKAAAFSLYSGNNRGPGSGFGSDPFELGQRRLSRIGRGADRGEIGPAAKSHRRTPGGRRRSSQGTPPLFGRSRVCRGIGGPRRIPGRTGGRQIRSGKAVRFRLPPRDLLVRGGHRHQRRRHLPGQGHRRPGRG